MPKSKVLILYLLSNSNYNGSGNPNVSYYDFEAYAKDASKIQAGEYLELTFNSASDTTF